MNAEKRRKKRLRNLVCIVYCSLQLLIVLALFQGMGSLLHKLVPAGIDLSQIEGKIVAVDDEQENTETIDENKLIVCLDAGHGGKDNGSDYRLRYEKNDNLKITQAVAAYLADKEDVQVIMTRPMIHFYRWRNGQPLQIRIMPIILCHCTAIRVKEMVWRPGSAVMRMTRHRRLPRILWITWMLQGSRETVV